MALISLTLCIARERSLIITHVGVGEKSLFPQGENLEAWKLYVAYYRIPRNCRIIYQHVMISCSRELQ